jgi:hypothetical protein
MKRLPCATLALIALAGCTTGQSQPAKLSMAELDGVRSVVNSHAGRSLERLKSDQTTDELVVIVKFRLSRGGYVEGTPTVIARGGTQESRERGKRSALNAVFRSQPFSLPPQKYSGGWDNVELTFHPEGR